MSDIHTKGTELQHNDSILSSIVLQMVSLYRDPQGERIFTKLSSTVEVGGPQALSIVGNVTRRESELAARVKELEDILSKRKV